MAAKWLSVDPGETTGFALWDGGDLVVGGQEPMVNFMDHLAEGQGLKDTPTVVADLGMEQPRVEAVICEEWQLYPWELENLAWDKCRTARLIGAITLICRLSGVPLIFQGADIKKAAVQAGAEALFNEPVHENRHGNDAIMHGVFYLAKNGKPPA